MELNFDIKQAKTYFKAHDGWIAKVVILGIMCILSAIHTIGVLFSVIYAGYILHLTNQRIFKPQAEIPAWNDIVKYFLTGFKMTCFSLLVFLVFSIPILPIIMDMVSGKAPQAGRFFEMVLIMTFAVMIIHVAFLAFVTDLKFRTLFKFKVMKFIVIDNLTKFAKYAWTLFLISLVGILIMVVSMFTIVGPIIVAIYLALILADINAQYIRNIFKIGVEN